MEGEGQMMNSGPKSCMRLGGGVMWLLVVTSVVSAQVRQGDASQSRSALPFCSDPDWLIASDDSQSGILQTDHLRPTSPGGFSDAIELSDEQPSGAEANPFDADLNRLQKRIDQLEASEKKRTDADKKKKEDDAKKAEGWQDMSTDKWTVKMGGHVQLDYINWANADPAITGPPGRSEERRVGKECNVVC